QHYQVYAADLDSVSPQQAQQVHAPKGRQQKPQSWGSQFWTLVRRYVSVIASDKGFLALTVLLPLVLGGVSTLIPSDYGLGYGPLAKGRTNRDASTIMLIIAVGMCFSGAANSVRE